MKEIHTTGCARYHRQDCEREPGKVTCSDNGEKSPTECISCDSASVVTGADQCALVLAILNYIVAKNLLKCPVQTSNWRSSNPFEILFLSLGPETVDRSAPNRAFRHVLLQCLMSTSPSGRCSLRPPRPRVLLGSIRVPP